MVIKRITADEAIWLRQPGEGEKAYAAFLCYLELGDGRTLAGVGRKLGKHRSQIDGWRSRFNWRERAAAYDNYLISETAKKARREVEARYERIGKNSDELLTIGMAAIKTAAELTPREALDAINVSLKLAEANRAMFTMNEREQAHDDVQNARVDLQYLKLEAALPPTEPEESGSNFLEALGNNIEYYFPNAADNIPPKTPDDPQDYGDKDKEPTPDGE